MTPSPFPACAWAARSRPRSWHAGEISESADTCGAAWAHGEHYAMVALAVDEDGDIEAATRRAYERLITCVRPSAHPYLLRIWNYFPAINAGDGDGERYRPLLRRPRRRRGRPLQRPAAGRDRDRHARAGGRCR
jgi:chorismate lyase/3-hydroxybenzoate synthase